MCILCFVRNTFPLRKSYPKKAAKDKSHHFSCLWLFSARHFSPIFMSFTEYNQSLSVVRWAHTRSHFLFHLNLNCCKMTHFENTTQFHMSPIFSHPFWNELKNAFVFWGTLPLVHIYILYVGWIFEARFTIETPLRSRQCIHMGI